MCKLDLYQIGIAMQSDPLYILQMLSKGFGYSLNAINLDIKYLYE